MTKTKDEELGIPPSVMTIEIFNSDGKRCNFEQKLIEADSTIEITGGSGERIILGFWQNRQPETNYPVEPETKISTG